MLLKLLKHYDKLRYDFPCSRFSSNECFKKSYIYFAISVFIAFFDVNTSCVTVSHI